MGPSRTVLLVEDEPGPREAMAFTLRRRGYEVVTVGDVAGAEEVLAHSRPDLLVTDMVLPGRSGFQLLRMIAEGPAGRVPVIMVSAFAAAAHRDYALAAGADAFLAKPLSLAELACAAETLCPLTHPKPGPRLAPRAPAARPLPAR